MGIFKNGKNEVYKSDLYSDAIRCMIRALEYRDPYTKGHSLRVGEMAALCAREMNMDQSSVIKIHIAGQLHDIGKIGVPDQVLLKEGRLTDDEWLEIRKHPVIGAKILSESEQLSDIAEMIRQHHERWDGTGYPSSLKAEQIDLGGRILALCDTLDAMASTRPYREPLSWDFIRKEISDSMGTQFDPGLSKYASTLADFWKNRFDQEYNGLQDNTIFIDYLQGQHKRIYSLIDEIRAIVNQKNSDMIVVKIRQLASILEIHLRNEDRSLYPDLIKHGNKQVRTLVHRFYSEMGNLSNEYTEFKLKYNKGSKIEADHKLFDEEFNTIITRLLFRLEKEDQELYPLAETIGYQTK